MAVLARGVLAGVAVGFVLVLAGLVGLPVVGADSDAADDEAGRNVPSFAPDLERLGPRVEDAGDDPGRQVVARRGRAGAQGERRVSRRRFAGLTRPEARSMLAEQLPGLARWRPQAPLRLGSGERVERYLGAFSARVAKRGGGRALVETSMPLRSAVGSGELAPVDLSLEARGSVLVARNPVVGVSIPTDARGSVRFPASSLAVTAVGQASVSAEVVSDQAFYANVLVDTDELVRPVPDGAEVSWVLRSEDSPESFALRLDLPDGVSAREDRRVEGAVAFSADGESVGGLAPPRAVDADGTPVAVSAELEGDTVSYRIAHRGLDVRYPLTLDPAVIEDVPVVVELRDGGRGVVVRR